MILSYLSLCYPLSVFFFFFCSAMQPSWPGDFRVSVMQLKKYLSEKRIWFLVYAWKRIYNQCLSHASTYVMFFFFAFHINSSLIYEYQSLKHISLFVCYFLIVKWGKTHISVYFYVVKGIIIRFNVCFLEIPIDTGKKNKRQF